MGTLCFTRSQFVSKKMVTVSVLRPSKTNSLLEGLKKTLYNSTALAPTFFKVSMGSQLSKPKKFLPKVSHELSAHSKISTTSIINSFNEPLKPLEKNKTNICWNCGADFCEENNDNQLDNLLTCSKCSVLRRPPKHINHFELFGIERKFKMDLKKLAQKYKSMQRILHPDRFAQSTEEERNLSDVWSPLVNEAYVCLKKPILRANYLLFLHGMPLQENENIRLDDNFLAEIVELNEEIIVAESRTDVAGLTKNVRDVLQDYYNSVEVAFDESEDIEKARRITAHMQYYENLKKQLVKRETELGIVH